MEAAKSEAIFKGTSVVEGFVIGSCRIPENWPGDRQNRRRMGQEDVFQQGRHGERMGALFAIFWGGAGGVSEKRMRSPAKIAERHRTPDGNPATQKKINFRRPENRKRLSGTFGYTSSSPEEEGNAPPT